MKILKPRLRPLAPRVALLKPTIRYMEDPALAGRPGCPARPTRRHLTGCSPRQGHRSMKILKPRSRPLAPRVALLKPRLKPIKPSVVKRRFP